MSKSSSAPPPERAAPHADAGLQAAIFDMDGVITRTATLHAAAWKKTFDDLLQQRGADGESGRPFDPRADYLKYVDGKPRREGVRSFLGARGISLAEADEAEIAASKDRYFACLLKEQGVQTFDSNANSFISFFH